MTLWSIVRWHPFVSMEFHRCTSISITIFWLSITNKRQDYLRKLPDITFCILTIKCPVIPRFQQILTESSSTTNPFHHSFPFKPWRISLHSVISSSFLHPRRSAHFQSDFTFTHHWDMISVTQPTLLFNFAQTLVFLSLAISCPSPLWIPWVQTSFTKSFYRPFL